MDEARQEEGIQMAANAIASGPMARLEEVFQAHHARVFRAAYRITGNSSDAEDVLQTVFLRLLRQDWSAGRVESMESYLHRAAVNAALDVVRARRGDRKVPLEDVTPVLGDDARLQPDRRQAGGEVRSFLRHALARLAPKAAEIFALRYFEEYSNAEIAQMLGLTAANVAVTLHRTRGELQQELKIHGYRGDWS
ncbi:MAG TPA: RNA polymerase sigma factor [Bryobacteraceae bacterium]